jgi:hypothetical protein
MIHIILQIRLPKIALNEHIQCIDWFNALSWPTGPGDRGREVLCWSSCNAVSCWFRSWSRSWPWSSASRPDSSLAYFHSPSPTLNLKSRNFESWAKLFGGAVFKYIITQAKICMFKNCFFVQISPRSVYLWLSGYRNIFYGTGI